MSEYSIMAEKISMKYRLPAQKVDNLKEYVIRLLKRNLQYKEFLALDEVSFNACAGDRIGILGLNGAGKSTLSKIVAGVLKPSCGKIYRKGKIAPLIELGAGFEQQYTGRENIFLYGSMLGYKKEYIASKLDEIIEFSELGDFIDIPLKNYSSGMKARLGFSIATACEPDILILDEVLSVGDAKFRKKSEQKVKSMMKEDTTVLFVSHSLSQVEAICSKVMILDHGKCIFFGDVKEGIAKYEEIIA